MEQEMKRMNTIRESNSGTSMEQVPEVEKPPAPVLTEEQMKIYGSYL